MQTIFYRTEQMADERFHTFSPRHLPQALNNPFGYIPDEAAQEAAALVRRHLEEEPQMMEQALQGKMFGVLVCLDTEGRCGFLAAFSGVLCGSGGGGYFVPAVCDILGQDSFFRRGEARLGRLTLAITRVEERSERERALAAGQAEAIQRRLDEELLAYGRRRELRHRQMDSYPADSPQALQALKESREDKSYIRRVKAEASRSREDAFRLSARLDALAGSLRRLRKDMSRELQKEIFSQFRMLSHDGRTRDLNSIFLGTPQGVPPSGAGECAGPKLLQYAFSMGYRPVSLAEFWVGQSPKGLVRRDGAFYPACMGKCAPILGFMLEGLPMRRAVYGCGIDDSGLKPVMVYEDSFIAVADKPAGLLTVPGKDGRPSLEGITGMTAVHRLDMDTSGLVILARDAKSLARLRQDFEQRLVAKRYTAVLDGIPDVPESGTINLPLAADYIERPYMKVDFVSGKEAVTEYRIEGISGGTARVSLFPLTGRTHQLRVHCAHSLGLGCPIKGDPLYGRRAERMLLHCCMLRFRHPEDGHEICLESPAPF